MAHEREAEGSGTSPGDANIYYSQGRTSFIGVMGILTTLVLAKVYLRLSRFNYERIEVLYPP